MRMSIKILSSLLLSFWALNAGAETLEGVLIERGTRTPLADVNLFILPQQIKATTDSRGNFKFENLEVGLFSIVVNASGYQKTEQQIQIPYSGTLNLYLEKENYRVFESVVTGSRNKRDENAKRLSAKDFLQTPGSDGDPIKAVQNLSGVARANGGSAQVIIQGGEPEDTGYLIENHTVPLIFHFGGLSSIVLPEAVESVDYYPAGYGPEFGQYMGGFVGLNTRQPKTDRRHGFFFADLINTGGLVEGPIDEKSSYLVGGRYSYVSFFLAEAFKDNESASLTVAPTFQDFSAIYSRKLDSGANFKLTMVQSEDVLEFLLKKSPSGDPYARGTFHNRTNFWRLIPQWSKKIDETTEANLSLAIGPNGFRVDINDDYLDIRSFNLTTRGEYIKEYSKTYKSFLGFDNAYNWYDVATKIPSFVQKGGIANPIDTSSVKSVDVEGKTSQIGLYWRNELKTNEESKATYIPTLRLDRTRLTNESLLQPRFAFKYDWDDALKLKAATGVYFQAPSPQQTSESYGNPEIKSQRAIHYTVGFDNDLRQGSNIGYTIGSSLFYKNLDQLVIGSSELTRRNGKLTPENYSNDGIGNVKGAELNLKYFESNWNASLAYTYTQSRRKSPGEIELPSEYDQTHSINLLASYEMGKWIFGSRFRYISGSPYTPIIGAVYDSDNDVYFPVRGDVFSERKKAFSQLDFRADRQFIQDTEIWSLYVDIQNLLNAQNEESINYSYNYKKKQSVTGLPTIPSFGIKGEF